MDLLNSQSSVQRSSCELPPNRAPTPSHSEMYYTSQRTLPYALYKSMSSNNIVPPPAPFYSGRATPQHLKPWRYPSSSTTRPVGLPCSISQQSLSCRAGCHCQCDSSRKQVSDFHSCLRSRSAASLATVSGFASAFEKRANFRKAVRRFASAFRKHVSCFAPLRQTRRFSSSSIFSIL
jgi:hypothetical protein